MKKELIIAEKPSAARAYAEALGGFQKRSGYLESSSYYLAWAVGHLVGLALPEEYDPAMKSWRLDKLPFIPEKFKLTALAKTEAQLKILNSLAQKSSGLIIATDSGREGQLIARFILDYLKIALPAKRLWISSLTKEAVLTGFAALKPDSEYDSLYQAACCRAEGDYLIGINLSRAFSIKYHSKLSIGRVQTPVLKLLVQRQQEIDNFQPEPFWELELNFQEGYKGKWCSGKTDRFVKREAAEQILSKTEGKKGRIRKAEDKESRENPPLPYDLTTLQREANRLFGYTAQETLDAAQNLYEAKLISYPRTDSRYLTRDLLPKLPEIAANLHSYYSGKLPLSIDKAHRAVNDKKVNDHHAVIPTKERPASRLAVREEKIYQLIIRRFLAQFYPAAVYRELSLLTEVAGESFKTNIKVLAEKGWREIEGSKKLEAISPLLLNLKPGTEVTAGKGSIAEKMTSAPKPYTEASLLGSMERPRLKNEEKLSQDMLDLLKEHGLGTSATRASIIERLKRIGYIASKGKSLMPTKKGIQLIDLVEGIGVEVLASPELTGEWEKKINDVYKKDFSPEQFRLEIKELTCQLIDKVKNSPSSVVEEELEKGELRCFCGNKVKEFPNHWACLGYRDGSCSFAVSKVIAGKKISQKQVKLLLEKKETQLLKGFKAKSGKKFDSKLVLREGKVVFDFAANAELFCPVCGKPLREFDNNWSCTGYKSGCRFKLWKRICGRELNLEEMKTLLQAKRVGPFSDFVSKQGKSFSASLIIDGERIKFEFGRP